MSVSGCGRSGSFASRFCHITADLSFFFFLLSGDDGCRAVPEVPSLRLPAALLPAAVRMGTRRRLFHSKTEEPIGPMLRSPSPPPGAASPCAHTWPRRQHSRRTAASRPQLRDRAALRRAPRLQNAEAPPFTARPPPRGAGSAPCSGREAAASPRPRAKCDSGGTRTHNL